MDKVIINRVWAMQVQKPLRNTLTSKAKYATLTQEFFLISYPKGLGFSEKREIL